jgi:predicted double-glycine peptidase
MPWFELFAIVPLVAGAILMGQRFGRSRHWWPGFALPLTAITLVILGHRSSRLIFIAPISWAVDIDVEPLLMAVAIPLMLVTLLMRMPRQRRIMIVIFLVFMVVNYSVLPPLCPLLVRTALASAQTRIDRHGICLQTHSYTCGPAAAVTCLRALGVTAFEGPLAIEARCGPVVGTSAATLAATLSRQFGAQGIHAQCRYLESLDSLSTPAIVETYVPALGGHYVAVLAFDDQSVLLGDPANGLQYVSRDDFIAEWKNTAVLVSRSAPHTPQAFQQDLLQAAHVGSPWADRLSSTLGS